jgi:hypothetical protein
MMKQNNLFSNSIFYPQKRSISLIFSITTCLDKAVWLEHQVFLATKSEPMYKMKYMSKVKKYFNLKINSDGVFLV